MRLNMLSNESETPYGGWGDREKEQVIKNAVRAVKLFEDVGAKGSSDCGKAMLSHSEALRQLNRYEEAVDTAVNAQNLFKNNSDAGSEASALMIIGNVYRAQGNSDAAMEAMEKARDLAAEAGEGLSIKQVSKQLKDIGRQKSSVKRPAGGGVRWDISLVRFEAPFCIYSAYEGRSMTTGGKSAPPQKAAETGPVARQKVLYNLRMQRVPNVDITSGAM